MRSGWKILVALALAAAACGPADSPPAGGARSADGPRGEDAKEAGGERRGASRAGGDRSEGRAARRSRGGRPGGFGPSSGGGDASRGVPVEVAAVQKGEISLFFETNGTLEAENEVDLVSRVAGPITQLDVEEGDRVREGQVLARLDDRELRAQVESARVRLAEAEASFERTRSLFDQELVSHDLFDQARAAYETAKAEHDRLGVLITYTEIRAPFSGLVVERYVKFAEYLQGGARLFRLSDFDPLLCPIQVPERLLGQLKRGQRATLRVEAFGERDFAAKVLRIRPVVDAATGTIEVTLEVDGKGALRPGMFASVALEMERREDTLVVPKAALALDSLRPTVFVQAAGVAERRELELGFRNDRQLEVLSGLTLGEQVVVVGQDGLADGTPIEVLTGGAPVPRAEAEGAETRPADAPSGRGGGRGGPRGGDFLRNLDLDDPEQVEKLKSRMRERGLDDAQIERRLERLRERRESGDGPRRGGG